MTLILLDVYCLLPKLSKRHLVCDSTLAYVVFVAILVVKARVEVLRNGRHDKYRAANFLMNFPLNSIVTIHILLLCFIRQIYKEGKLLAINFPALELYLVGVRA